MSVAAKSQITGNVALFHIARELSRRGWHCMPTVRNARGADLYASSQNEELVLAIQSKGLSAPIKETKNGNYVGTTVPLGADLTKLRSSWWIITTGCNFEYGSDPVCFILQLEEVRKFAFHSPPENNKNGKPSHWLQPRFYAREEYREAWHRLGDPHA